MKLGVGRATVRRGWQYGIAVVVWRLAGREPYLRRGRRYVIGKARKNVGNELGM